MGQEEDRRESRSPERRAARDALRLASIYAALSAAWILFSDRFVDMLAVATEVRDVIDSAKGLAFVVVSAVLGYVLIRFHLTRLYGSQEELRKRDESIRQAYIDVLDAVTGGTLLLMSSEDLGASLGEVLVPMTPLSEPDDLRRARHRLAEALRPMAPNADDVVLAASEGLTNAVKHGEGGRYGLYGRDGCIQVVIQDSGPGLDFRMLPKAALVAGFSTKPSLGMGFTIMLDLSDRLLLATEPGLTTLVLEFDIGGAPE